MMLLHKLQALDTAVPHLDSLKAHLQVAVELEMTTLPPYLCALYSITDGTNVEAAGLIRSVMMEEMLHIILAANVLNAIGGSPVLARKGVAPEYPTVLPHSDGAFSISLQPFSRAAIADFMRVELPTPAGMPPKAEGYDTIGQFYEAIKDALVRLRKAKKIRFDHHPERQVDPADYYNGHGKVIQVTDLESALKAINEIMDQGEGTTKSIYVKGMSKDDLGYHLAHYYRFWEISAGRRFKAGDTTASGPTGNLLPVDWNATANMISNPQSGWFAPGDPRRDMMDSCNAMWKEMLRALEDGLNGKKDRLVRAVPFMLELKKRAKSLMNVPSGIAGTMLGPSFEWPGE